MRAVTQKQENFCHAYLRLGSAAEAYRECYDSKSNNPVQIAAQASKLLQKENVKTRLAELREEHREREAVTIHSIAEQLQKDREYARETGNAAAAVRATEQTARLFGLMVDKHEHQHAMRPDDARDLIEKLAKKYLGGGTTVDAAALARAVSDEEAIMLAQALMVLDKDDQRQKAQNFFPDEGPYRRDLYPGTKVFRAGRTHRNVCFSLPTGSEKRSAPGLRPPIT